MRNPFRIRASQRHVGDEEFVRLFGAGALELLDTISDPWGGLVFLRSAPGGGKTTLLRLLTPRPLRLTSRIDNPQVKETCDALRGSGAIGDDGVSLLGSMVTFATEYRDLADFDRGNGLFRALLNCRIVMATLKAVVERAERADADDLATFEFAWRPETGATIPARANGKDLSDWAERIEREFYERIDDLDEQEGVDVGHLRLDALTWFARCSVTDAGVPVDARRVLLLDEMQELAPAQRTYLTKAVTDARESCGIWVAERLVALNHADLLSEGALQNRDFERVIQLEQRWSSGRARSYTKFVEQIARLRAAKADAFEHRDFLDLIADREGPGKWDDEFAKASEDIEARLRGRRDAPRYATWCDEASASAGSHAERAVRWRNTEILVERAAGRAQGAFDFDVLSSDDLHKGESSAVERAAEHFLRSEVKAPIYFGREVLSAASSSNVDQYLELAGELFEEVAAQVRGPREDLMPLTVERQDDLIRGVARRRWEGLVHRLPNGYGARRFLEAVGALCRAETFRPTAPYAPGVTGIAITMSDRKTLIDSADDKVRHLVQLRDVLTSLVANNLLVPQLDRKTKGKAFVVFYLNRLLCVQFGLPLGYGGWREQRLLTLDAWLKNGPQAVNVKREAGLV